MKSKKEADFTTLRIRKETAKAIKRICANRLVEKDKISHPYEIIDELLKARPLIK